VSTSYGGYPETYLIVCRDFMALLDNGLPHERPVWAPIPATSSATAGLVERQSTAKRSRGAIRTDEWLLVEAWDES
jgi:hypothetical protein